jgi:hypothetical protein
MTLAGGPVGQVQGWKDIVIVAEDDVINNIKFKHFSKFIPNLEEGEDYITINNYRDIPHEVYPRVSIIIHEHLCDTNSGRPRKDISDNIFRIYSHLYETSKSLFFVKPSSFQ